jgi:hypothetical protein
MQSWHNQDNISTLPRVTEEYDENHQQGKPVFRPSIEHSTFQIRLQMVTAMPSARCFLGDLRVKN